MQQKDQHNHVLNRNERRLAVRAECESLARIVGQSDSIRDRLQEVGEEGDTARGFGANQLEDLRELDDASGAHDAQTEGLGGSQFGASTDGKVNIFQQRRIALFPNQIDAKVARLVWKPRAECLDIRSRKVADLLGIDVDVHDAAMTIDSNASNS